jgi:hypothetical protein
MREVNVEDRVCVYCILVQNPGSRSPIPRLSHRQKGYTCAFLSFWDFTMLKFDHMEVSIFQRRIKSIGRVIVL